MTADTFLTDRESLDHATMWRYMQKLVDRLFGALDGDSPLDDALDILVDLFGADRGLVLLAHADGSTHVINARGQRKSLSLHEREEMSRTIIRNALESGTCVAWDPLAGETTTSSVALLGIRAALAAPLYGKSIRRGEPRGVLYLDFRDARKHVTSAHVEFFMASATLVGAVLEQFGRSESMRDELREARAHFVEARHTPPLADLLATPSMQAIRDDAMAALHATSAILLVGESGTGKTLLAQAIAEATGRRPVVRAVLGSSDDLNTITSELFGHERGAFSGATAKRVGLVEFARGGTLILDEVLNLPPHAQQLLLDFTQFGTYRPLGYDRAEPKRADVRIIAATNGNLREAIREKRFREDLYYRLATVTLELPPLRRRREDIPAIAESALRRADPVRKWSLELPLRRLLQSTSFEWPGNVRQLEAVIARARARAIARDPEATSLTAEHVEPRDFDRASFDVAPTTPVVANGHPLGTQWQTLQGERARVDEREQDVIRNALQQANGVVAHAARALGIARTTLSSRIDALGIHPRRGKGAADEE